MYFIKIKNLWRHHLENEKVSHWLGQKYLKCTYLTKELCWEYIVSLQGNNNKKNNPTKNEQKVWADTSAHLANKVCT